MKKPSAINSPRSAHFSAGVVPIYLSPSGAPRFLILRCYGYWDFPKGGLQGVETPLATALRELKEETTIESVEFKWGHVFSETPPYSQNKVARYYTGQVLNDQVALPVNPELGRPEHHEFRWLCYKDARELLNPRMQTILDWAQQTIAPSLTVSAKAP